MPLAFVGNAGSAIFFMCLFVLAVIVGTFVLSYAAYSFFVVVQDTAAGIDEVVWPGDPVPEWLGRLAVLAWLVLVWLAPLGMFGRGLIRQDPAFFVLLAGVILWLFFPIGVLSALSGGSRWLFFRPKLLLGLVRIAPTTLGFYVGSALLVAVTLSLWYVALSGSALLVAVAASVGSAVLLIYARLLGRLAWRLNRLKGPPRPPVVDDKDGPQTPRAVTVEDPWAEPPQRGRKKPKTGKKKKSEGISTGKDAYGLVEDPDAYRLATEERKGPRPIEPPDPEGYALSDEPLAPRPVPAAEPEAYSLEMRLAERTPQEKIPSFTLFSGVFTFPFYPGSQKPLLWLTIGGGALGLIVRMAFEVLPR
jgi:hypothetical protein